MKVIEIPLDQIEIGERRRRDYGDLKALARGIKQIGLLHPIVVDRNGKESYRLVTGERRLRAAQILDWSTIPATLRDHLSEAELHEIELEENENRKSLTEQERRRTFASSKQLVEDAKKAREILGRSAPKFATKKTKRGRPSKSNSTGAVAEDLGTSRRAVKRAEQHVATAERLPVMQGGDWRQSDVLRVDERLQEVGEEAAGQIVAVLGCARILDPELTVDLIENLGAMKPAEREKVYQLSQSKDPRDRSLALTEAARKPPMPDPRLGILDKVLSSLNAAIKPYPKDPLTPRLIEIRSQLVAVRAAVKEVSYDAQRDGQKGRVQ